MMKEREYLNAVLGIEGLSDKMKEETEARLAKIDEKNEKRKSTQTKLQRENEPIAQAILTALGGGAMLGVDLATAIGQTVSKTNGVAGNLVKEGVLTKTKIKVKGKGSVKGYSLAEVVD
jgi:hypothetical protein